MKLQPTIRRLISKLRAIHWVYVLLQFILLVAGMWLATSSGPILQGIGGSLIAGAMAGLVLLLHSLLSEERIRRLDVLQKFGLVEMFDKRSVGIKEEYDIRLERVRDSIDIIGFGLRSLRQDYQNRFQDWARHATVRILLLDPDFLASSQSIADQRDLEENDPAGTIRRDVEAFVRECSTLIRESDGKFQVRLYRCLPSINIFRIDGFLFWGPYLIGDVSRNFPTLLVNDTGSLYPRLVHHFESIWSNVKFSRDVPEDWMRPDGTSDSD